MKIDFFRMTKPKNQTTVQLYGINDGSPADAPDGWDADQLTWNNAPANVTTSGSAVDAKATTLLAEATAAAGADELTFSDARLGEFVKGDTNGRVTFIIAGDDGTVGGFNSTEINGSGAKLQLFQGGGPSAQGAASPDQGKGEQTPAASMDYAAASPLADSSDPYLQTLAQELEAFDPGLSLLGASTGETLEAMQYQGNNAANSRSLVSVADAPGFDQAYEVKVSKTDAYYDPHFDFYNAAPVRKGEIIYMVGYFRSLVGGLDGKVKPHWYDKTPTAGKGVIDAWQPNFPDRWVRRHFWSVADKDYPAGTILFRFNLGYDANQTIQFGGVAAVAIPGSVEPLSLPQDTLEVNYDGREPDAAWRQEALARIEKIRKADLTVKVVDSAGKPVPDASVAVEMTRHAFVFGCETAKPAMFPGGENMKFYGGFEVYATLSEADKQKYRDTFKELFNAGTGGTYWYAWDPASAIQPEDELATLKWLESNGLAAINGAAIYPRVGKFPRAYRDMQGGEELRQAMSDQNARWVELYGDYVDSTQIGNEWSISYKLREWYGNDLLVEGFKQFKELKPEMSRGINETHASTEYYEWVEDLLAKGAPIDTVGLQWHSSVGGLGPQQYLELLDRFSTLGPALQVTEFDAAINDPSDPVQQAWQHDYTRDCYIAFFSQPKVEAITYWGMWKPLIWQMSAKRHVYFYDENWNITPAGKAYRDLVLDEWWTKLDGTTGTDGTFSGRGFKGDYTVTAAVGSKSKAATTTMGDDGQTLTIQLD